MNRMTISSFTKDFSFLSNFFHSPFIYDEVRWPTVEHAFQAAKTLNKSEKEEIRFAITPTTAKRLGRKVTLRSDWEDVKISIMYKLVEEKFQQHPDLAKKLRATGDELLVEGNYWHDNIWGSCCCKKCIDIEGANNLGFILMLVRRALP